MDLQIKYDQYFLDNGLRVILHEDHSTSIVALNVWYHVGSKNEHPGKTGFAHLFEHLMFQGSQHVQDNDHFRLIQEAGGIVNGSTSFDRTNYFEVMPSNFLELGLWLESDRMGYLLPAMDQPKLDNQRDVVKNERRQTVENRPYGLWLETMQALAYPEGHPYSWPIIGHMTDLDNASLTDVQKFFKTWYAPNNASLVIAGDFDHDNAVELIRKYFGELKSGKTIPERNSATIKYFSGEKRTELHDDVQLPRLHVGFHIPGLQDKSFYVAELLSDIFSRGRSSRLYHSMVYRDQLVQSVSAFVFPTEETALLMFVATPYPGIDIARAEQALYKEIDRLIENGIEENELQRIKNQVEAEKVHSLQTNLERAESLNRFATYFDDPGLINTAIDSYMAVTAEQLNEFCATYLQGNNRVVVSILPNTEKNNG